jgi:adhesin transport system membrane fusion protein
VLDRTTRRALIARRLTQPLALEDGRPPRILRSTLYTISAFVLASVVWAALAQVQELTIAQGQVIPRGQVEAVHHLEGGIVAEIYVHEGMRVTAQQPLVRLRPESAVSERSQFESRRAALKLQLLRLEAQSHDETPNFGSLAAEFPDLAAEQEKLNVSAVTQLRQEHATLSARAAQKRSDIAMLTSDLQTARSQYGVQLELLSIQDSLQRSGSGSRKNWLEAKSLLQRAEGEALNFENKLATARGALAEAESSLSEAEAKAQQKLSEERVKAGSDLAETEQQLIKFFDRFDRLVIRAPSDGIVQELAPKSPGEVIRPGDLVARIVPTDRELIAEVRIDPKDAGHIREGADADIRFATYDSSIFGQVQGKVEYLSATTFSPPPGQPTPPGQSSAEPYYKATIQLSQDHVSSGAITYPITPGMVLQAHIKTGSKSIIRYMFKPVFNSLEVAFSER